VHDLSVTVTTDPPTPPSRPGAAIFTIEGRAAPGLFVAGWLATIVGLGPTIVGYLVGQPILFAIGLAILSVGLVAGAGAQAIERRARGADAYQGPSPVLVFVASIPVGILAAVVIGFVLRLAGFRTEGPLGDLLLLSIQAAAYIAIVRLLVIGTGALSWREMGFSKSLAGATEDLGWGAVFAGPVILGTLVVQVILVSIFGVSPESPLTPTGEPVGLAANLIAAALVAPIGEEIIFRGVATTAWVRSLGVTQGIVRAALFFAIAHILTTSATSATAGLSLAIVGFAARLPVALVLGWVFVRRGSIYASIGLHAAFNGILIVLADAALRSGS
jgi:membrane protease YdiL (CAAX protease family)